MKKQFVTKLTEGDVVNDYYVAIRKDLRNTQSGGKFLGMVFKDRTGEIGGVLWNNAPSIAELFDLGDVVNVRGTVTTYQNRLQLRVDQVLPLKDGEYDPADLVQKPENVSGVIQEFRESMESVQDKWLSQLVQAFLDDESFMTAFTEAAAGKKWHHAYPGGLIQHCHEMVRIAETVCELFPEINRDILLTGVFLHDIGKTIELSQGMFIEYTTEGKLIGHLQLGCTLANRKMDAIDGFPEELRAQILHLILSHHGELEQGSPVVPKTLEAIVLSHIDDLDAQVDAFRNVIDTARSNRQEWSDYIGMIGRQIWTGPRSQGR